MPEGAYANRKKAAGRTRTGKPSGMADEIDSRHLSRYSGNGLPIRDTGALGIAWAA